MQAQTDEWMHNGHNAMPIARWPSARGAKNNFRKYTTGNPLSQDKILNSSVMKAFVEVNLSMVQMMFVFERLKNILGKGENASYQHFLLFPKCFQKSFSKMLKSK